MAVAAAREAMQAAGREAADVDGVLLACSNLQRAYPAIAVEVQQALGVDGFGFDMNVACSSATFALQIAADSIRAGSARRLLIVNPEICSAHLNFRDRDSHFIFGDVCTALMVEHSADCAARGAFEIVGSRLKTRFSNNIRNNRGFLNPVETEPRPEADLLFVQRGRKVFKEVIPLVARLIREQLDELRIAPEDLARLWLHQANLHMNTLIAHKVLGRKATDREAPVVLDEFANTSSAGSIIAFHRHSDDLSPGDMGVICSFGAGYSVGSVVVRRLN
jgi:beta-ketodecanoyl-[acyl-carrier-protein] synthase